MHAFSLISHCILEYPNKDSKDLLQRFLFLVSYYQDCFRTAKVRNKTGLKILESKFRSFNSIFRCSMGILMNETQQTIQLIIS